jgi:predicted Zn finger-like uncharacterized protein
MIVQCEACAKRYWIDDKKIVKERMALNCPNCANRIAVLRPRSATGRIGQDAGVAAPVPPTQPGDDWGVDQNLVSEDLRVGGMTIGKKLLLLFSAFILLTGAILTGIYLKYVPALMYWQVDLRTYSISHAFSTAIQQPLLIKNYLLVNQIASTTARLPGVAYVSVLNNKGTVVAGVIGDAELFSPDFMTGVEKNGFPEEISSQNSIPNSSKESSMDLIIDGHKILDVAVAVGDTGGEAHVGLFTEEVESVVRKSLIPLMALLAAIALLGSLSFFLVARTISAPIRSLALAAEKISLGDIDLPIELKGGGEIGELAASLERMRFSIKAALNRLRRN